MLTDACRGRVLRRNLRRLAGSAVLVGIVAAGAYAQTGETRPASDDRIGRMARGASGTIEGVVEDALGEALAGAMVSALGVTNASTVTDTRGRFALRMLPPGAYIVRAHLQGFIPSRRQLVDVRPNGYTRFSAALERTGPRTASLGGDLTGSASMMAAALGAQPAGTVAAAGVGGDRDSLPRAAVDEDDHSEIAWRLRHLTRSVLKQTTDRGAAGDAEEDRPEAAVSEPSSTIGRAMGSATRFASSFFGALPLTGEVNLVTTGALGTPVGLFSPENLARSVAYVSIGGPARQHGDWSAQVLMSQADVGSWYFSGSYRTRAPASHMFDVGVAYSLQRASVSPSIRRSEGGLSRSAGTVYVIDRWTPLRKVTLVYGGSFSRYDYLPGSGLFSPRASVTFVPVDGLRIQTSVSRRMLAPGAEEFLQPMAESLWVPPARTFVGWSGEQPVPIERISHYEVSLERDLSQRYVVAFRTFFQQVTDQEMALFGFGAPAGAGIQVGQYAVATSGDVSTRGWSIGLSNSFTNRVRGSVWYAETSSTWTPPPVGDVIALLAVAGLRQGSERLHDLTTSVETEIPWTATRVFAVCKINTGFARREAQSVKPGLDSRFDLQVTQRLPFLDFSSTQWQVLIAVRNLFRDSEIDSSAYDELLVVRPPKRFIGGVLVRF